MSLLGALLSRSDPLEERTITPSQLAWARGDFPADFYAPAGVRVDRDTMLSVSAVWACVSLISDSIATLPLQMYTPGTNGSAPTPSNAPTPGWLDDPNPEQTIVDFKFGTVASLLLHGNAFTYLVRDRKMNILEAWLLDPRWVQVRREPQPDGSLALNYYVMVGRGMQSPVGPFKVTAGPDMFHIMAFQPNSSWPMGISPIDNARMMWGAAIAGQEMGTRWFSQGFNAAGVIETADDMTLEQAQGIKQGFKDANTGGPSRMHLPPVLTGGATWKQIQISPEQAQFLQQRQFAVDEIARWFRVPPHMIGNLEKTTSWGSGIEEQSIGFVKYTLRPWLERIEHSWNRNMLTFENGRFLKFDTKALERGNMVNQADFFTKLHGIGMLTANEGRGEIGLPPFEGGDEHYFMVNTAPVGTEPIAINKPKADEGDIPKADAPPVPGADSGDGSDDGSRSADLADGIAAGLRPLMSELGGRVAAATAAAVKAQREAEAASEKAAAAESEAAEARSSAADATETAEMLSREARETALESDAELREAIEKIQGELAQEKRENKKPKLRTVTLSDGRTGKLLIDGSKRILELENGSRIEVDTEDI